MHSLSLPMKLLLATILGAVLGLERESSAANNEGGKWGLRTYSLISLLGAISGFLYLFGHQSLSLILTASFFVLIFIFYAVGGWMIKSMGLTTELGGIFSYLIGYFVTSEILPINLIIAITIVVELILSIKGKSRSFTLGIHKTEIDAFIGYAIIALVILPFLPNQPVYLTNISFVNNILLAFNADMNLFTQLEIFNPSRLWFLVVLFAGIEVSGYVIAKLLGKKGGILITSIAGGFVSSTAVSQTLATKSKSSESVNSLVAAATFGNMASFIRIILIIAALNRQWLVFTIPVLIAITLASLASGLIFYLKDRKKQLAIPQDENTAQEDKKIFSLKHALTFAFLLVAIQIVTKVSFLVFGGAGFLFTSILGSLVGLDAVTINISEITGKLINSQNALLILLCVNSANLFGKVLFSLARGSKKFTINYLISSLFIIVTGFITFLLLVY